MCVVKGYAHSLLKKKKERCRLFRAHEKAVPVFRKRSATEPMPRKSLLDGRRCPCGGESTGPTGRNKVDRKFPLRVSSKGPITVALAFLTRRSLQGAHKKSFGSRGVAEGSHQAREGSESQRHGLWQREGSESQRHGLWSFTTFPVRHVIVMRKLFQEIYVPTIHL